MKRAIWRTSLILGCLALLCPVPAHAQAVAAASLFGVKQFIVLPTSLKDQKAAQSCGLTKQDFSTYLGKELDADSVPVQVVPESMLPTLQDPEVNLIPVIASVASEGLTCSSWLSLTAEIPVTLRVPPVNAPRRVIVTLWYEGAMVTSDQAVHEAVIEQTLQKMATHLSLRYRRDQSTDAK